MRGAGRTDAGVHALGQVAHFDLAKDWEPDRVRDAVNFHLRPHRIAVLRAVKADAGFDARFSALKRHYRYRVLMRRAPPVLDRDHVWWLTHELDPEAMHDAAQVFIGKHDFTTFRAAQCQAASPVKTLDAFAISGTGEEIICEVSARSFLHHQVRSMVGTLKLVGEGRWTRDDVADALAACNREACGPVAPASGLYLVAVDYPPHEISSSSYPPSPSPEIPDA
jgi:tRNA pseudouridine38-40 synthase